MGNNEKYEGMNREDSIKNVFNKMGSERIQDLQKSRKHGFKYNLEICN